MDTCCEANVLDVQGRSPESPDTGRPLGSRRAHDAGGMAHPPQPGRGALPITTPAAFELERVGGAGEGASQPNRDPGGVEGDVDRLGQFEIPVTGVPLRAEERPSAAQAVADTDRPHGAVNVANILLLLKRQGHRCALSGRTLTPKTAALDHILPVGLGGQHRIENTQVLDRQVNRAKGVLTNDEFIRLCREVADHATGRQ